MAGRATQFSFRSDPSGYPRGIATEVERKFLVEEPPAELTGSPGIPIRQGYLAVTGDTEIRLRQAGEQYFLTIKRGRGESRSETEAGIERATFDQLWPETEARRIEKFRRTLELEHGLVAEVDSYEGDLLGTSVVEVEFDSVSDSASFWPPAWFGRELTGDNAWANQSLAVTGIPDKYLEYRLRPGEEIGSAVCRIVTARASQSAGAVRAIGNSPDPATQVHQVRKSLKKTRSALRLLRGVIDGEERRAANRSCRDAARRLSGARDAQVKVDTLASITSGEPAVDTAAIEWRRDLEREASAHDDDLTPEALADIARQIESVARTFRGREIPGAEEQIVKNLARTFRRGRKAMKRARGSGAPESFHAWRKRAKDLRYQLEFLEPQLSKKFSEVRKEVEDLGESLGGLHDLDVLAGDFEIRELPERECAELAGLLAEAREGQAEACLDLGRETYRLKPRKFGDRLGEALSAASAEA